MFNFAYRVLRVVVFSILLIPVCGVLAEQDDPSWIVRMPVIQPIENIAYLHDFADVKVASPKHLVSRTVIRAESVESVVDDGPVYKATFDKETIRHVRVDDPSGYVQLAESDIATDVNSKKISESSSEPSKERTLATSHPQDKFSSDIDPDNPRSAPSVSLLPNGNAAVKQQRSSESIGFFTTPKRAVGLSGTVVKAKPSLMVRETYDSNIDYKKIEDLVTEIKPALSLDVIGEESSLRFRGDFIYRSYLNNKSLNRYDYNLNLTGTQTFSPNVEGTLVLMHNRRHNLDQNTYDAGGVSIDPTIILSTVVSPEINWRVGEKDNLNLSLNINKTDYERKTDSDYLSNVLSLIWGHALDNELTTLYAGSMNTYTHYSREIDDMTGDQLTFQGVVGIDHQFTPALKLSLKGGPGMTFSNYSSDFNTGDDVDMIYQFRFELGYRELEFEIVPALERVIRPGQYGENEILDQAELYYRYEFSEYLVYNIINTAWIVESDGVHSGAKRKTAGVFTQSVLNWVFEEDWNVSFGFSYNYAQNQITNKVNERAKTWVGLSYSFPTEIN